MLYKDFINLYVESLKSISQTALLDLQVLVEHVTGLSRSRQILDPNFEIPPEQMLVLQELIKRRSLHEPIAYLINSKGFWKYDFYVDNRVLIPRPETEIMVEEGLKFIRNHPGFKKDMISILDLGCGSGCIGLSIYKDLLEQDKVLSQVVKVTFADLSKDAIEVSKINAKKLNLLDSNFIEFIQSDWFENLTDKYDLIVSNPPYIDINDPRVYAGADFEPSSALYSGNLGLKDMSHIISQAGQYLKPKGMFLGEIGAGQQEQFKEKVNEIITDSLGFGRILVLRS